MKTSSAPQRQQAPHAGYDFFSLVEKNADGILVVDPLGHILYANQSAATMLGRSADELRGQSFGVPICPGESTEIELHGMRGARRYVEMRLVDFNWEGRSALLATLRDITQRKLAQEAANEALRLRDQFLAMLSHELRNPVGAISNAARVIEHAQDKPALALQATEVIARQARQMGRLLDDLLDVTRVTRGQIELQRQVVDFAQIVSGAIDSAGPVIETHGHRLNIDCPPDEFYVDGDPARLQQVLDNLLTNAAKYTPDGGEIDFIVEGTLKEVKIHVRDSGVGIPAEIRKRIFDLFVQADDTLDRASGGLGIGLTLVRMLVQMHEGTVSVRSRDGQQGSHFTICLPRAERPPARAAVTPERTSRTLGASSLLLVDDNEDAQEMLLSLLSSLGYQISTAEEGHAAVTKILRERPQAAIVDIGLPGLNGYEVARRVRQEIGSETTRLIALTGYGQISDRRKALQAGFDEHLVKPVNMDRLIDVLSS